MEDILVDYGSEGCQSNAMECDEKKPIFVTSTTQEVKDEPGGSEQEPDKVKSESLPKIDLSIVKFEKELPESFSQSIGNVECTKMTTNGNSELCASVKKEIKVEKEEEEETYMTNDFDLLESEWVDSATAKVKRAASPVPKEEPNNKTADSTDKKPLCSGTSTDMKFTQPKNSRKRARPSKPYNGGSSHRDSSASSSGSSRGSTQGKKKTVEVENDPVVLARRQKQIDYGKNTIGYERYIQVVPRSQRKREHPKTPPRQVKYSRRAWDGLVRIWRQQLHLWDPESNDTSEQESGSDENSLSHDKKSAI